MLCAGVLFCFHINMSVGRLQICAFALCVNYLIFVCKLLDTTYGTIAPFIQLGNCLVPSVEKPLTLQLEVTV